MMLSLRRLIARLTDIERVEAGTVLPAHIEALVPHAIDLVAQEIEPNLVHLPRYRKLIEPSVRRTIAFLQASGRLLPAQAVEYSAAAWSASTELNTLFATPADIDATLQRCTEMRDWFLAHAAADSVFAWLGAERHERAVLGMALRGDLVQRDVMQTTLNFDHQRVVFPAESIVAARVELGLALFRGLLAVVLERVESGRAQSRDLAERQAMLKVRLRRLRQQQQSIAQLADAGSDLPAEIARAEHALAEIGAELNQSKARFATLDSFLTEARQVLDHPEEILSIALVPVRVDRMGVCVGPEFTGVVNELTLCEIRAPSFQRVAVLVHCARAALPAAAR